jgi:peptide deformylase
VAIRTILKMGNAVLYQRSAEVSDATAPAIKTLLADMRDTLNHVQGIGLAAAQIGMPQRIVLYCLPAHRIPAGSSAQPVPWTAMINPVIETIGEARSPIWERCLSLPGLYAKVPRFDHIRISYLRTNGERVTQQLSGFLARMLQHECDHLDGILYPMRMEAITALAYASEVAGDDGIYRYSIEEFDAASVASAIIE